MIYLTKISTTTIIGCFDTIALAKSYLSDAGITDYSDYMFLRRIEDMTYISRICYVDNICIYNNKTFWMTQAHDVYTDLLSNAESHTMIDFLGNQVDINRFWIEMNNNSQRLSNIYTSADEVYYNMTIGNEFISLFREECITSDLGNQSALGIASATANVIPLVLTGSFKEAAYVILGIQQDDFFTASRLQKYRNSLLSADVITYLR